MLTCDPSKEVRRAVSMNPSTPLGNLAVLAADSSATVRTAAGYRQKERRQQAIRTHGRRRPSVFDNDYAPYGRSSGGGNPDSWRTDFRAAVGLEEINRRLAGRSAWEVLEIEPGASQADIRRAFRRLVRLHHPDRGGSSERVLDILAAWETLKDLDILERLP